MKNFKNLNNHKILIKIKNFFQNNEKYLKLSKNVHRKIHHQNKKYTAKHIITFGTASLILIISMTFLQVCINSYHMQNEISKNVLRLHIIAEDNEAKNQVLKLCVRDRILKDFSQDFSQFGNIADSKKYAEENLSKIQSAAEDELCRMGHPNTVYVSIEECCKFPTKEYGNYAFPAGKYTALNVKIGNAKGKNWWCVMYPPLCINTNGYNISEKDAEKLKSALTAEEYQMISKDGAPTVKLKFRIAEILGKLF